MRKALNITIVVFLFVVAGLAEMAEAGIRCQRQLVQTGDTMDSVAKLCGPADAEYEAGQRIVYREVGNELARLGEAEVITRKVWVYRESGGQLRRELLFENGRLVKIDIGSFD